MEHTDAEIARAWLAENGVLQTGLDAWIYDDEPGRVVAKDDIALNCSSWIFEDEELDEPGKIQVALGMVDLIDEPWTLEELHFPYCLRGTVPPPELWAGLRDRLEAESVSNVIEDSIWHTWFECRATSDRAYRALVGDDLAGLDLLALPTRAASDSFLRRARRVLELSGPVSWDVKEHSYRSASRLEALRHAVFKAILASYHDLYGDLEPGPALDLLDRLDLPEDTEHLAPLRTVLVAGHRKHYATPDAWTAACEAMAGTANP